MRYFCPLGLKISLNLPSNLSSLIVKFAHSSHVFCLRPPRVNDVHLLGAPCTDDIDLNDSKIKAMVARWVEVVEIIGSM
jgi:hypothetical protein